MKKPASWSATVISGIIGKRSAAHLDWVLFDLARPWHLRLNRAHEIAHGKTLV